MNIKQMENVLFKASQDIAKAGQSLLTLSQSITHIIQSIKQVNQTFNKSKACFKYIKYYDPGIDYHRQNMLPIKCDYCKCRFTSKNDLAIHINSHHLTKQQRACDKQHQLTHGEIHKHKQPGSSTNIPCQLYQNQVQKKCYRKYITNCEYRICYKCNQNIIRKAYGYHLKVCKVKKSLITNCKQFNKIKPKINSQNMLYPLSSFQF